jgi:hypothetical protein
MSLRMPKKWNIPLEFYKPNPSIVLPNSLHMIDLRTHDYQSCKYLNKNLIDQFFDEIDDTLIYNSEYGKDPHEVVTYYNGFYWIVVHPSAIKTIEALDVQFALKRYIVREIVKVPNEIVNVLEYWK